MAFAAMLALVVEPTAAGAEPAATEVHHALEPRLRVGSTSVREDLLVPLAFTGPTPGLELRYGLITGPHRIDIDLLMELAVMANRFGHEGYHMYHTLGAGYLGRTASGEAWNIALGGSLRWQSEISYLASWDNAHAFWLSTLGAGFLFRGEWRLAGCAWLEGRAEFGVAGLASRPPERRLNKQDALNDPAYFLDRVGRSTELTWIGRTQQARISAQTRFRPRPDAAAGGWGVGLESRLSRDGHPEPYAVLYAGIIASYQWSL